MVNIVPLVHGNRSTPNENSHPPAHGTPLGAPRRTAADPSAVRFRLPCAAGWAKMTMRGAAGAAVRNLSAETVRWTRWTRDEREPLMRKLICVLCGFGLTTGQADGSAQTSQVTESTFEYRLLATTRTSTLEREMNEATEEGYRFQGVMGGNTSFGGSEVVSIMMRSSSSTGRFSYRLLATNRTSTMQDEMQEAGDEGYRYRDQTVFESFFGGEEVVVIMELDNDVPPAQYDYLLLATSQTSTLQSELSDAGQRGFALVGVTVGSTAFGGDEVVVITYRERRQ